MGRPERGDPALRHARARPSAQRCIEVGGVDWLEVAQEEDVWTFISYGRSPATEIVIDTTAVSTVTALEAVSGAVDRTERVGACS